MNSRERYEFYSKNLSDHYKKTAEEVIETLVNKLIESLYIPIEGWNGITKVDPNRIKHFGIDDSEPMNWGSLRCTEVKKLEDDSYLVVIEEAAPQECRTLCEYIENYMRSYGWRIKVETEW